MDLRASSGRIAVVALLALVVALLASPSAARVERAGIVAPVPAGWRAIDERLTPCVNPLERLTLAGPGGGMVMLQESLDPRHYVSRFDRRPEHWRLVGRPHPIACCAPSRRPGWFMNFRDAGRAFYVYVYGDTAQARRDAVSILDRLTIRPRT